MSLSIYLIKKINPIITAYLTIVLNQIISEAVYPSCIKTAKVVTIFKERDNSFPCYRPISLVPVMRKVFKKLLSKRIILFSNKFDVLNNKKFGFRNKRSTIDATVQTLEVLIESKKLIN